MNKVGSQLPTNLFVSQGISSIRTQVTDLHNLRLQQQVFATIVEVNQDTDEAVLDIAGKNYRTPLNETMQPGQMLQLEVIKTQPGLEFRVLGSSKQDQLAQLFSTLSQPFDWSKMAEQVQILAKDNPDLRVLANLFQNLQQAVLPDMKLPPEVATAIKVLVQQMQNLESEITRPAGGIRSFDFAPQMKTPALDSPVVVQNWNRLLTSVKEHIEVGQQLSRGEARSGWYGQTRDLLSQLQEVVRTQNLPSPQLQKLQPLLNQLQQLPVVTPQLARDIKQLDLLVQKMPARIVTTQDFVTGDRSAIEKGGATVAPERHIAPPGQTIQYKDALLSSADLVAKNSSTAAPSTGMEPRSGDIEKIIRQIVTVLKTSDETVSIPAKLSGQLEGGLTRMVNAGQVAFEHLPYVEALIQELQTQSNSTHLNVASFKQKLGVVAVLFGFSINKRLAPFEVDKKRSLLQQGLNYIKEQLAGKGDEPLQRLELLQLCREKLAEQQIQFIPLPFNDLEEGYLLFRHHTHQNEKSGTDYHELELSLALRLSAIGSVRVDMLYDPSGLRLQLAGEDEQKMHYLERFEGDLKGALHNVRLLSVNFKDDAQLPTPQLKKRVFPEADQLLNTRI